MNTVRIARFPLFIIVCLILFSFLRVDVSALSTSEIVSETAILMDAGSGQVLYSKEMNKRMYPASVTKIMTALLVLENCRKEDVITVSEDAVIYDDEVAHIALCEGEEITVEQALFALMLPSANDAANALAEHVAGSQKAFVQMMNDKAVQIGTVHTHFANAHGLHDKEHYSTAYDLALITRYAMSVPEFMEYYGAEQYVMPSNNLQLEERPFVNGDSMLLPWKGEYDKRVLGGKVGYTDEARHTMSTVAVEDGRTLICVVMSSMYAEYKYSDTKMLLGYGVHSFCPYTIPSESFSSLIIPIGAVDSPHGDASFQYPYDLTVLLPNDIPPESIEICYNPPPRFSYEEDAACSILLVLKESTEGLPPVLINIPMERTITPAPVVKPLLQSVDEIHDESKAIDTDATVMEGAGSERTARSNRIWTILPILLFGITFAKVYQHRIARKDSIVRKVIREYEDAS